MRREFPNTNHAVAGPNDGLGALSNAPMFAFCEGFRMTAHREGSACTRAVVRNPPVKERAGEGADGAAGAMAI